MIHVDVLPFPIDGKMTLAAFILCPFCEENLVADIAKLKIYSVPCPRCQGVLLFDKKFHDEIFEQAKKIVGNSLPTGAVRVKVGAATPLFSQ